MIRILFIGDIVGEGGLAYLESHLPLLRENHKADLVIANGENIHLTPGKGCGMDKDSLVRLFTIGVDVITGGNHSWEGPDLSIFEDPRLIRPRNVAEDLPGHRFAITSCRGIRIGVVNLVSRTAVTRTTTDPLTSLNGFLCEQSQNLDCVLVDFHGDSVMEKMVFAYSVPEPVIAVLGTHTHVPTMDPRIINSRVAYISDVGMTGPGDGVQGYHPEVFSDAMKARAPFPLPQDFAPGPVELGAVLVTVKNLQGTSIKRINLPEDLGFCKPGDLSPDYL